MRNGMIKGLELECPTQKRAKMVSLSKLFIRCKYKNALGKWINVPLGIIEVDMNVELSKI